MKSSRKRRKLVEDGRSKRDLDKISNLPDELLLIILSFLPTIYAMRSRILSRRWRHLFPLTDNLISDDVCFKHPQRMENFKKFVYKVLELNQMSPIRKFRLVGRVAYNKSDLNAWVTHAGQRGVQELYYSVNEYGLPDAFAMCKTLVKLKVIGYLYHVTKFSLSSGLPNLKILHLKYVKFDDNHETERLLSNCEFLEELTLDDCKLYTRGHVTISIGLLKVLRIRHCYVANGILEIEAPNLAYLTYYRNSNVGVKIVPLWKNSCSLVEAKLYFDCRSDYYRSFEDDRDILRDAAYKTTVLHLLSDSAQCLLMMDDKAQVPVFHSLTRLHLPFLSYNSLKSMTSVMDKCPRLETVVFETSNRRCCEFWEVPRPSESLVPFSCNVKVIKVHDFCVHDGMLLLVGHLLRNARVLKKLILHKCQGFDDMENARRKTKDLLMLPRASTDCCIKLK